jgi:hypothetical protein
MAGGAFEKKKKKKKKEKKKNRFVASPKRKGHILASLVHSLMQSEAELEQKHCLVLSKKVLV